eukprot:s1211_g11.t1
MALEERWVSSKTKTEELRVREHFVVFELPREGAIVQDFRIAAIELDAMPAKERETHGLPNSRQDGDGDAAVINRAELQRQAQVALGLGFPNSGGQMVKWWEAAETRDAIEGPRAVR